MTTILKRLAPIAATALLLCGCCTSKPDAKAWEYKVVEVNGYPGKLETELNNLTSAGWELVSVSTTPRDQTTQVPFSSVVLRRPKH